MSTALQQARVRESMCKWKHLDPSSTSRATDENSSCAVTTTPLFTLEHSAAVMIDNQRIGSKEYSDDMDLVSAALSVSGGISVNTFLRAPVEYNILVYNIFTKGCNHCRRCVVILTGTYSMIYCILHRCFNHLGIIASYLARAKGSNEPELSIARTKDLDQFIRECRTF